MPKGRILYGQMAYLATYANLISVHHYLYNTILQYYLGNLFTVVRLKILTGTALGLHSYRVTFLLSRLYFLLESTIAHLSFCCLLSPLLIFLPLHF